MPSHPIPHDEVPNSHLCSFNVDLRFRLNIAIPSFRTTARKTQRAPPPYSKRNEDEGKVVRWGPVRVEECGTPIRSWFFKVNWLVLTETHLALHASANKAPRAIIPMSDIMKLERTEIKLYCLVLKTKHARYLLTFRSDDDLYGWQDAISYRSMGIGPPFNFQHKIHVGVDRAKGIYTGLPDQWAKRDLPPPFARPVPSDQSHKFRKMRFYLPPLNVPSDVGMLSENVLLRIAVNTATDPGHVSITLAVPPDTRMRDVLGRVCRKTRLEVKECALVLAGDSALKPLAMDDTVADLQDNRILVLVILEGWPPAYDNQESSSSWLAI
ncbi:hypothetical protein DFH09DRAFT_1270528 [Mycena vulgaris]|nr:hypothetical protein DFH09DRAFT_1270528 [Mycena vulgaris]